MLNILINAYACSPKMGSEPGMAWNWCSYLAKHCNLHIITEGEFQRNIEEALSTLPQAENMHFYYNPVSKEIRKMCWNQGDWRFYYYYNSWQAKTLKIANNIIKNNQIDIIHQLNMIGFREPGYLWKIERVPFIWGPINAKEKFPTSYLSKAGWKNKLFIYSKNILNILQLSTAIRVKNAINKANFVIAASSDSQQALKKYFQYNAILINESGCEISNVPLVFPKHNNTSLELLWVGRFIFTKQLTLALETIATIKKLNIRLHIVGGSLEEELQYKDISKKLKIESNCVWHSRISHEEVQKLMRICDLFFFTSIAEGTPHVILEAFSNNLPVLCFNTCGHGDSVNEQVGIKIPLSTPQQSINDFAEKITYLFNHRDVLKQMSENCRVRQEELSWDNKAKQMVSLYEKVLSQE